MGLLCDYEPSDRPSFEALIFRSRGEGEGGGGVSHITPSIIVWSGMGTLSHKNLLVFSSPIKLIVFSGAL